MSGAETGPGRERGAQASNMNARHNPIMNTKPGAKLIPETFLLGFLFEDDIPQDIRGDVVGFINENSTSEGPTESIVVSHFESFPTKPGSASEYLAAVIREARDRGVQEVVLLQGSSSGRTKT